MNNKLPWEAHFYGTIDKRTIRDAEKHTVNVYDTACAEFIVTACNAYEASQTEIAQLKAKLELCREAIQRFVDNAKILTGNDESMIVEGSSYWVFKAALEAIEGSNDNDKL